MFGKSHKSSSKHSKPEHSVNYSGSVSRTSSGMRDLSAERSSKGSLNFVSRSASLGRERGRTASDSSAAGYSTRHGPVSPLNLPSDNMQPMSYNQGYIIENLGISGMALSLSGKSSMEANPVPMYGRAHSLTNVARERSLDRIEKDHVLMGERSLDRMQIHVPTTRESAREMDYRNYMNSGNTRDRSLDREREYPHMGARSLERDHHPVGRSRSSEHNGEYMASYLSPSPTSQSEYRNSLLFELQVQVSELHKECAKLQKELDNTKDKLSSSMNSIKTFWSPELKKERSLRKEETAKCNMLNEQLKVAQAERQKDAGVIENLEANIESSQVNNSSSQAWSYEYDSLKKDKDRQLREILILRKTIDEMELRIGTQKQTLAARDESIKKLLEMLQSKGLSTGKLEEDRKEVEHLQSQIIEHEQRRRQLEKTVGDRDNMISELKEQMDRMKEELNEANLKLKQQPASTHTMQAMLEAKESRISALENEVLSLEDKLLRIREDGSTGEWDRRDGSLKNSPSTKDKSLRMENNQVKADLAKRDNQLAGLRMKVETLERQHSEQKQYIVVLKEQITAKELHSGMLQADIEDLQDRLKEKDTAMEKKSLHSQNVSADRRRMETEVSELRDHLEIKERKVNVLQRKIETLDDLVNEKDELLNQAKMKLSSTFTDSTDSAVSSLEESLHEKDKQLERLRDQRDKMIKEHQEELDLHVKTTQDVKSKVDAITQELNEKQTQICEMREEATELHSEKFICDNQIRQLQSQLSHKIAEVEKLHQELLDKPKENSVAVLVARRESIDKDLDDLTIKVTQAQEDAKKATSEVARLLEVVKQYETEKTEKDSQIQEMQEIIKEYKQKMGTLKRNQRTEKEKNAHLLEEARKSEKNLTDDASQLQNVMHQKHERIEELEEALRESVRITAQREMDMAEQKMELEDQNKKVLDLKSEIDALLLTKADLTAKVSGLSKQHEEKDSRLKRLQSERQKHLQEVFEMKQEAIQAAISEKDANIALLEMTSTKKQTNTGEMDRLTIEKEKLNSQLKELTQNHMRLLHRDHSKEGRSKSKKSSQRLRSTTPELVDPYVLTAPDASLLDS